MESEPTPPRPDKPVIWCYWCSGLRNYYYRYGEQYCLTCKAQLTK